MKWTSLTVPLMLCLALMLPHGALAAGGPVPPVQGSSITVPGDPYRYAVLNAGRNTAIERRDAHGRTVTKLLVVGQYGIPAVDYGGSMTGLSADGRTLVLAQMLGNSQLSATRLLVLDTGPLAVRGMVTLSGFSTVDAISPDGRWLYLIHYAPSDISRYEVQAYDLRARRLLAKPVVDPRDRGEAMTGIPINRVMSAGGRWAYTLYLRPSGVPFVHALDTAGRRAVCVDLPSLSNLAVGNAQLVLSPGGGSLRVVIGGSAQAAIDTRTFTVGGAGSHEVASHVRPSAHAGRATARAGDAPWELIVLSIAALAVAAAGARVAIYRRRRGNAVTITDVGPYRADQPTADEELPVA